MIRDDEIVELLKSISGQFSAIVCILGELHRKFGSEDARASMTKAAFRALFEECEPQITEKALRAMQELRRRDPGGFGNN